MHFTADTMFPGDLFDAASRFAARFATRVSARVSAPDDTDRSSRPVGASKAGADAWRQAAAMGWPALLVDEASGGAGGTLADLAAVVEACARQATRLPLVRRCVLAPSLLIAANTEAATLALRALCAGEIDIDVADGEGLSVQRMPDGGVRVAGTLDQIDGELPFTDVLAMAGDHLVLLPRSALPAASARYAGIDGARRETMTLDALDLPACASLLEGSQAIRASAVAGDLATLVTAIEMAAMLGAGVEQCIQHLSTRVQFGVALSTFQVLRHHVVDLYVRYESASVLLARLVHDTVTSGRLGSRDAALCKLYLNDLARVAAETSIQLHGAMGMTAELPATRLALRQLCAGFEHGDRRQLLSRLRDQVARTDATT